jgi:hypothetical protein
MVSMKRCGRVHPLYSEFFSPDVVILHIDSEFDGLLPEGIALLPAEYAKGLVVGDESQLRAPGDSRARKL